MLCVSNILIQILKKNNPAILIIAIHMLMLSTVALIRFLEIKQTSAMYGYPSVGRICVLMSNTVFIYGIELL